MSSNDAGYGEWSKNAAMPAGNAAQQQQDATFGFGTASVAASPPAKAKTYDEGKLPLAWLPWDAVRAMNAVQEYGHKKYGEFSNYKKGMEVTRNLSCALRHISEYIDGNDLDDESKLNHLAHAMCRVAFVLQNLNDGTAIDDRYKA